MKSASFETSATNDDRRVPGGASCSHAARVSAMLVSDTSQMATWQPSAASWRVSSRPMPVPPPVTTASLPVNVSIVDPPCDRPAVSPTGGRPGNASVGAQLDDVAVGVAHVEAATLAPRPEEVERPAHDVERPRHCQLVEVDVGHVDGHVVDVLTGALAHEQVEDRAVVDADRDERDLAASPLVQSHGLEAEQLVPPGDGLLGVGDVEDDVVDLGDSHRGARYAGGAGSCVG